MASLVGSTLTENTTRSGWRLGQDTGDLNVLLQEEYDMDIQRQILEKSNLLSSIRHKKIKNADTYIQRSMSGAGLEKLERNTIPGAASPIWDEFSIRVDTPLISRTPIALLDTFVQDRDYRAEIAEEHVDAITEFTEPLVPLMLIKAAQTTMKMPKKNLDGTYTGETYDGGWWNPATNDFAVGWGETLRTGPSGFKGGTCIELAAENDEYDYVKIEQAVLKMCERLQKRNMDVSKGVIEMDTTSYYVLLQNDRLMLTTFTTMPNTVATGYAMRINGVQVRVSNRMPKAEDIGTTNLLSNPLNGNIYNTTLQEARAIAVWYSRDAVLALDLIPHASDFFYDKMTKTWYLDDVIAFALAPNKVQCAGAIFRNAAATPTKASLIAKQAAHY